MGLLINIYDFHKDVIYSPKENNKLSLQVLIIISHSCINNNNVKPK